MCDKRGYFVFLYDGDGAVTNLAGSIRDMYRDSKNFYGTDEVIKLPRAFMMGHAYSGRVFRTESGRETIAVIPIESKPLAL